MTSEESLRTPSGLLTVGRAQPEDLDALLAIDASAYAWRATIGFPGRTPPRPLPERFAELIARGEMYIARLNGLPAAKIVLQREDSLWSDAPGEALYVHGLATHRDFAGKGISLALLAWAERTATSAGTEYLRLDCDAKNPGIRTYYERAGFAHRGDVALAHLTASRYEKCVDRGLA